MTEHKLLLVGDNPFHGISHLSQERSRLRDKSINTIDYAANIVSTSLNNGAEGFMFSVSETTLSILNKLKDNKEFENIKLYAIVPYAYEYVRLATQVGGIPGLGKKIAKQIISSMNFHAMAAGLKGILFMDPNALLKTYIYHERARIKAAIGKKAILESIMLHEIITEMALAFNLDWFFKSYIEFLNKLKLKPGFETRNFPFLVQKFKEWNIDFNGLQFATAFNKMGFQMNPNQTACEQALKDASGSNVIVMSILASGYLKPSEAAEYIKTLPNVTGVVVGISKEHQAKETFQQLSFYLK